MTGVQTCALTISLKFTLKHFGPKQQPLGTFLDEISRNIVLEFTLEHFGPQQQPIGAFLDEISRNIVWEFILEHLALQQQPVEALDRKSVEKGKRVEHGGSRTFK